MKLAIGWLASFFFLLVLSSAVSAQTSVFIDDGVLYGVSNDSVLKNDLRTGDRTISYRDGHSTQWQSNDIVLDSSMDVSMPSFVWVGASQGSMSTSEFSLESEKDQGHFLQGNCQQEANALIAAINFVQTACSGDGAGSQTCQNAQNAYDSASASYQLCLRTFLEYY